MESFVAIDFETANQHRSSICSIGLVVVENKIITQTYYQLIKPIPDFYSHWNTKIHGLTKQDTNNAAEFPLLWQQIQDCIQELPLVAHNSAFDESCLKATLAAYNLPLHTNPFYCTYRQAKKSFPELANHKLNTVAHHLGYDLKNHHHALDDAQACAHIAMKIF